MQYGLESHHFAPEVPYVPSELDVRNVGISGYNSYLGNSSAARIAMASSQTAQALVVAGSSVKRLYTRVEREYGGDLYDVRFPCDAMVRKIIRRISDNSMGYDRAKDNPITTIIYEDISDPKRTVGVLHIPTYHSVHQHFGFNYTLTDDAIRLVEGACIKKDTVIATSPSLTRNGDYKFGLGSMVALMSMPQVIEDGVLASKSWCRRAATKAYGRRVVSWGRSAMPLNLYGGDSDYKPFPDIGEVVNDTGLLFASRTFDKKLSVPLMSKRALQRVDYFDKTVYAHPGARIVDIQILKGNKDKSLLPFGMDTQCQYYWQKTQQYYGEILATYNSMRKTTERMGSSLSISPELQNLLVRSIAISSKDARKNVTPVYNRKPIDEWMVEIVYEYDVIPTIGFKITGLNGDKGVICDVWDDERMPTDAAGNRAELVMDGDSTIKRTNLGRTNEHYVNASGYATMVRVREMKAKGVPIQQIADYVMGYYQIVSPPFYKKCLEYMTTPEAMARHVNYFIQHGHYIFVPPDNPVSARDVIRALRKHYPAINGPVTYTGWSGRQVTTFSNIIIGEMYILLLEKVGNTWSGVASSKTQVFGIPAKMSNEDKFATPGRHNPTRILGESEIRLIAAMCGGDVVAELLDQTNNPVAHRNIVENILMADKPTDIQHVIDRAAIPRGNGRIVTYIRHYLECAGLRFVKGDFNNV